MNDLLIKLLSRKFILAIVAAIVPIVNQTFGLNLDDVQIGSVLATIAVAIAGIAYHDSVKAKNPIPVISNTPLIPVGTPINIPSELTKQIETKKNTLQNAIDDLNKISKLYSDKTITLLEAQAMIEIWRKNYVDWAMLVPPNYPGI